MKEYRIDLEIFDKKTGRFLGRSLSEFCVNRTGDLFDYKGMLRDEFLRLCVSRAGLPFKPVENVFAVACEELGGQGGEPLGLWAC